MLGELFKLVGKVVVETGDADNQLDDVVDKARNTEAGLSGVFNGLAKVGTFVVAGATAAGTAALGIANKVAESADKWDKLSLRTGIAVENLQAWGYAADQSGADIEKLEVGIKTLSESQMKAIEGNEDAIASYEKLGITMDELKNMTPEETFEAVMKGLAGMKDGAERNSIGNQLLGKSFVELKPLLAEGVDGMQALKDRAYELGLVLSEDTVDAGVEFGDRMADLKAVMGSFGNEIAAKVMPHLTNFINWCIENAPVIREGIGKAVEFTSSVIGFLADKMNIIVPILSGVAAGFIALKVISVVSTLITTFQTIIAGVTGVVGAFNAVLAANPIGMVVLAIAALIAAGVALWMNWDTVVQWAQTTWDSLVVIWGGLSESVVAIVTNLYTSVIQWFVDIWNGTKQKVTDTYNVVAEWFGKIPDKIKEIWDKAVEFLTNIDLVEAGKNVIAGFIDGIGQMAGALWNKASEIARGVWNKFQNVFKFGSPSKRMRQAGRWSIQGHILGMEDEYDNLVETADKFAKVAAFEPDNDYTQNALPVFTRNINYGDRNDTVHSILDYIVRLLERLVDKDDILAMDGYLVGQRVNPHIKYGLMPVIEGQNSNF